MTPQSTVEQLRRDWWITNTYYKDKLYSDLVYSRCRHSHHARLIHPFLLHSVWHCAPYCLLNLRHQVLVQRLSPAFSLSLPTCQHLLAAEGPARISNSFCNPNYGCTPEATDAA